MASNGSRGLAVLFLCLVHFLSFANADGASAALSSDITPYQAIADNPLLPRTDSSYDCSASNPCSNGACCGASGYCGYGPTYCGTGCVSQCSAKAACGQYAADPGATCPLNVCCSQYGFCGTTSDFCGTGCQSNCQQPSSGSSGGNVQKRLIGYYESCELKSSIPTVPR